MGILDPAVSTIPFPSSTARGPPNPFLKQATSVQVVYDQLVVPENPISNYLTDKSGITEQLLQGVTTRLEEARNRFLQLVSSDTILVSTLSVQS